MISTSPISGAPVVQPLLTTATWTFGSPIFSHRGKKTCCMYSLDGDLGTFVPPKSRIRNAGCSRSPPRPSSMAKTMYGKMACQMSQILPGFLSSITSGSSSELLVLALPIFLPGLGLNTISRLPTSAPSTFALHSPASQSRAAR